MADNCIRFQPNPLSLRLFSPEPKWSSLEFQYNIDCIGIQLAKPLKSMSLHRFCWKYGAFINCIPKSLLTRFSRQTNGIWFVIFVLFTSKWNIHTFEFCYQVEIDDICAEGDNFCFGIMHKTWIVYLNGRLYCFSDLNLKWLWFVFVFCFLEYIKKFDRKSRICDSFNSTNLNQIAYAFCS